MTETQAATAERDALADQLFDSIGLLRRQARRHAGRPWPLETLSGSQVEVVRLLRRRPGLSITEVAAELGLAANTVSTLVGQLTDLGVVRRTLDAHDRRIARLQLTAPARRRVEQWRDRRTSAVATAIESLPAADRAALARAVPVIADLAAALAATSAASAVDA